MFIHRLNALIIKWIMRACGIIVHCCKGTRRRQWMCLVQWRRRARKCIIWNADAWLLQRYGVFDPCFDLTWSINDETTYKWRVEKRCVSIESKMFDGHRDETVLGPWRVQYRKMSVMAIIRRMRKVKETTSSEDWRLASDFLAARASVAACSAAESFSALAAARALCLIES